MYAGKLTLADCLAWGARYPHKPPTINGEWAFIAIRTPEVAPLTSGPPPVAATLCVWSGRRC